MPRRAGYLIPGGLARRHEIMAACAVLAVLAHALFAQLTLVFAVAFHLVTTVTRWRPRWLAVPAAAGLAWTAGAGVRPAVSGFAAGPAQVAGYLGASGHEVSHALHLTAGFAGLAAWLPRQLPLAIVSGAAEAAVACWLAWPHRVEPDLPSAGPGLIAAARRAATARAIRAGGVVTRDGGCVGVAPATGSRITVSWSEAAGGVAVYGSAGPDVLTTSFQLVHAGVRRRKPVLALDVTADPALPGRLAAVCAAAGAPLQVFGPSGPGEPAAGARPACYEPFRHGDRRRRVALVAAMLRWDDPAAQYRRGCLAYLQDVFELLDAVPGDPRAPVLDEVVRLASPTALRARMTCVPAAYPGRDVLAERIRLSVSFRSAQPAAIAGLARQLRDLRASAPGYWLRPPTGPAEEIDLGRAVTGRRVVLFRLGGLDCSPRADSSAMVSRLVCQDLLATATALRGIGVDGDGIIWLAGCGPLPRQSVRHLIAGGAAAGLPVLATTTAPSAAADLAELVNVVVAYRMDDAAAGRVAGLAAAAGGLAALRDGEFALAVKSPPRRVPRGLAVRDPVRRTARDARAARPRQARGRG